MCLNLLVFFHLYLLFSTLRLDNYTVFQKKLHRPTFDILNIETPCPNRDIVEVLKIQH